MQRNAKPVYLEFGNIFEFSTLCQPLAPFRKAFQIVEAVRVVERHQRNIVNERLKGEGLAADPLCRAVRCDEFRVLSFECLKTLEQLVKFEVRDLGLGLLIIEIVVPLDLTSEGLDPTLYVSGVIH